MVQDPEISSKEILYILSLLQSGLDQNLALSIIKGQILALVVLFQRPLACHSLSFSFPCTLPCDSVGP